MIFHQFVVVILNNYVVCFFYFFCKIWKVEVFYCLMHNILTLIYAYLSVSRWMFNNYVKFFILFHLSYTPTFWFNSIFYFLFIFHFFFCFKTSFFLLWKKFVKVDDFTICRAKQKFCLWDCIVNKNEVKIQSKMYECILLLTTNCCLSLIAALLSNNGATKEQNLIDNSTIFSNFDVSVCLLNKKKKIFLL